MLYILFPSYSVSIFENCTEVVGPKGCFHSHFCWGYSLPVAVIADLVFPRKTWWRGSGGCMASLVLHLTTHCQYLSFPLQLPLPHRLFHKENYSIDHHHWLQSAPTRVTECGPKLWWIILYQHFYSYLLWIVQCRATLLSLPDVFPFPLVP